MGDVDIFFNAKTFAVVGASRDEKKVGHIFPSERVITSKLQKCLFRERKQNIFYQ